MSSASVLIPFTAPAPKEVPAEILSQVRVNTNAARSITVSAPANGLKGILATARDAQGNPTQDINGKTKITVKAPGGSETTLSVEGALNAGILAKDDEGNIIEAPEPEAPKDPYENSIDPLAAPPLDPALDKLETSIVNDIAKSGIDPMRVVTGMYANDATVDQALQTIARARGQDPVALAQEIQSIHDAHAARLEAFFRGRGLDPQEVWAFEAKHADRGKAIAGRVNFAAYGSTKYFNDLVAQYKLIKGK